jgi:tetratricopeptide (TPR) repeat protein
VKVEALEGRYSAEFINQLVKWATQGGDVDRPLNKALKALATIGPDGETLKDEVTAARKALRRRDSEGSVGRVVGLAEWMRASGFPEFACLLCALGINMRDRLGDDTDPNNAAYLSNVAGLLAFGFLHYDTANQMFLTAIEYAESGDRRPVPDIQLNLVNVARYQGRDDDATALALEALAEVVRREDIEGQLQLLFTLGNIAFDHDDNTGAATWLSTAEPLIGQARTPNLTAGYHHLRALLSSREGDFAAAEAAWKLSLAAARRARDHDKQVAALQNLAAVAADAGNHKLALRRTRIAVETAADFHLLSRLTALLPALIRSEANYGDTARALRAAERLLEVAQSTNNELGEAHALYGATLVDNNLLDQGIAELNLGWDHLAQEQTAHASEAQPHVLHNLIWGNKLAGTLAETWPAIAERVRQLPETLRGDALQDLGLEMLEEPTISHQAAGDVLVESLKQRPPAERAWSALTLAAQADRAHAPQPVIRVLDLALTTAKRRKQATTIRHIRNDLALALTETDQFKRARALLAANLAEAREDEDLRTQQLAYYNLAEMSRRTSDPEAAETYAIKALDVATQASDNDAIADCRLKYGMCLSDLNRFEEATAQLNTVLNATEPGTDPHTSAIHSLAGVALGAGDPTTAADLYRQAVAAEPARSIQRLEALLGWAEALAACGDRRTYNRMLQQVVDAFDEVLYTSELAIRMTRIARRWARNGKYKFAGEILALALLITATPAQEQHRENYGGSEESVSYDVLVAIAAELHYETAVEPLGDPARVLAGIETEFRRHMKARPAKSITNTVRQAVELLESDEQ